MFTNKEKLLCGHRFCNDSLRYSIESVVLIAQCVQKCPEGTRTIRSSLPSFEQCRTIVINYNWHSESERGFILPLWVCGSFSHSEAAVSVIG